MRVERAGLIHCPVDEVFALAADPDNDTRWGSLVIASRRLTGRPITVGSLFEQTASFMGTQITTMLEVTAYERNRAMCYRTNNPVRLEHCRHFDPTPEGTRLQFTVEADVEGRFKLAGSLLSRVGERQVDGDLASLKALLESSQTRS